jgi:hypothetical protein
MQTTFNFETWLTGWLMQEPWPDPIRRFAHERNCRHIYKRLAVLGERCSLRRIEELGEGIIAPDLLPLMAEACQAARAGLPLPEAFSRALKGSK